MKRDPAPAQCHVGDPSRVAELLDAVRDEDAAVSALELCVARIHTARAARVSLANLDAGEMRAALELARTVPGGDTR